MKTGLMACVPPSNGGLLCSVPTFSGADGNRPGGEDGLTCLNQRQYIDKDEMSRLGTDNVCMKNAELLFLWDNAAVTAVFEKQARWNGK